MGNVSAWWSLSAQWECVLSKHGVKSFHSADFNARRGVFANLPEDKRPEFIDSLLQIIEGQRLLARAVIIEKSDYQAAILKYPSLRLDAYQFCCYYCAASIGDFFRKRRHVSPVEVFFEAGQRFHNEKIDSVISILENPAYVRTTGVASITVAKKQEVVPFQVADLIVYELYKAHLQQRSAYPRLPRYEAVRLNRIMKGYAPKLSTARLVEFLAILARST